MPPSDGSELPRAVRFKALISLYLGLLFLSTGALPAAVGGGWSFWAAALCLALGAACGSTIWGLVMQYLEGREASDLLFSSLNTVVIFGPSAVRAAAGGMLQLGLTPSWMPLSLALLYAPVAIGGLCVLERTPEPPAPMWLRARSGAR